MGKILSKMSIIQFELTSDEVEALKSILSEHKGDYELYARKLLELIS